MRRGSQRDDDSFADGVGFLRAQRSVQCSDVVAAVSVSVRQRVRHGIRQSSLHGSAVQGLLQRARGDSTHRALRREAVRIRPRLRLDRVVFLVEHLANLPTHPRLIRRRRWKAPLPFLGRVEGARRRRGGDRAGRATRHARARQRDATRRGSGPGRARGARRVPHQPRRAQPGSRERRGASGRVGALSRAGLAPPRASAPPFSGTRARPAA